MRTISYRNFPALVTTVHALYDSIHETVCKEITMTTIKAIVRAGRIELKEPIDLPDGTELTIPLPGLPETLGMREEDWSDTPEAIDAWLHWYDSLEPLEFTPAESAAWKAAQREQREFELDQWEKRSKQIEGQFP
jgi:hypothetical protein